MTSHRLHFVAWLVVFLAVVSNGQAESGTQKFVLPSKFPDFGIFHSADINNEGTTVAWCDRAKGRDGGGGVLELGDASDDAGNKLDRRCELMRFSANKSLLFVVGNHNFRSATYTNFIIGWNYRAKKREFLHQNQPFSFDSKLAGFWKDQVFFQAVQDRYDLVAFKDDGSRQTVNLGIQDGGRYPKLAVSNRLVLMDRDNTYTLFRLTLELESQKLLSHAMPDLSSPRGTIMNSFSKDVALHPQLAVENNQHRLIEFQKGGAFTKTQFHQVRIEGDRFCAMQGEELGQQKAVVGKVENGELQVKQTLFQGQSFSWPVGLACSQNMKHVAILRDREILLNSLSD